VVPGLLLGFVGLVVPVVLDVLMSAISDREGLSKQTIVFTGEIDER
jgi:hypothetical protein